MKILLKLREQYFKAIILYGRTAISQLSKDVRNNKELMLIAVPQSMDNLEYVSEELKNDKDVVMASVVSNPVSLKYASEDLKNNF